MKVKAVILNRRGPVSEGSFSVVDREIKDELAEGEVLIQSIFLSVDPYMNSRINGDYALNEPLIGGGVSKVVKSKHEGFKEGDYVSSWAGKWQDFNIVDARSIFKVPIPNPASKDSLSWYLGVLGLTGLTAYHGLLKVGEPKQGETVVVSAAAGATGSIVGQIAKIKGCYVVGIAGAEDKIEWITKDLGFDSAINYKKFPEYEQFRDELKKHCPKGIDVYYDNVSGMIADAVLELINVKARVALCGGISQYEAGSRDKMYGMKNILKLVYSRAKIQGFVIAEFAAENPQAVVQLSEWIKQGKIKFEEHVVNGMDKMEAAFMSMMRGDNKGKVVVKVAEP